MYINLLLFWRCNVISKELLINERINDREVRLIGEDGSQYGIVSLERAIEAAAEKNLDLVKVAPRSVPPVCRLMDYGKYKFELAKKEKEQRKNQKVITIKEVRITPNIDEHDFNTKLANAIRFLKSGDKVKVTVRFRGREVTHSSLGVALLERFGQKVIEYGTVENRPKLEGRNMSMFISPNAGAGQPV
ncbi:MAG: translation initiation factor IF-3 [Firmicutes bacterium]|nr:translation initiation factor IF-3 [Bacillota bacterium]